METSASFRVWRRVAAGVCAAMVIAGLPGAARGGAPAGSGTQRPTPGVWPVAPVLPWGTQASAPSDWSRLLNARLNLTRRGRPGEKRRYVIRRQHLTVDARGRVVMRQVSEAALTRTLLRKAAGGDWVERLDWTRFAAGQAQGSAAQPPVVEVPQARGISYELSLRSFDPVNPAGDYARIPDPMAAYSMKVLGMDVVGFDSMVQDLRQRFPTGVRVGAMAASARWAKAARIKPGRSEEVGGQYRLGDSWTAMAGVTRCQGLPCALVFYSAEGNTVQQEVSTPQLAMRMEGTEYFRAVVAVSLLDGHVVAGEVWGPVPSKLLVGLGGQPLKDMPITGIMQQVSLWEVR